jgi:hypothetical protein
MKSAKELMLGYIDGTAEQSASLFADEGTLELPYLASMGLAPVLKESQEIGKFLILLHDKLYPGFSFETVKIDIHTPRGFSPSTRSTIGQAFRARMCGSSFSATSRRRAARSGDSARLST